MRQCSRIVAWQAELLGFSIVSLIGWIVTESAARLALDAANFSHQTYWRGWFSWGRKRIECSDREIKSFDWISYFPNLQEMIISEGSYDFETDFRDLQPLTRLSKLRDLRLSGVRLRSLQEFPVLPSLETVFLSSVGEGGFGQPSEQELEALKSKLPRIRQFTWNMSDESSAPAIRYDAIAARFVWVPESSE